MRARGYLPFDVNAFGTRVRARAAEARSHANPPPGRAASGVHHGFVFRLSAAPPLGPGRALSAWQPNLPVLVLIVALGAGYLTAVRRRSGGWPISRTISFFAGLG